MLFQTISLFKDVCSSKLALFYSIFILFLMTVNTKLSMFIQATFGRFSFLKHNCQSLFHFSFRQLSQQSLCTKISTFLGHLFHFVFGVFLFCCRCFFILLLVIFFILFPINFSHFPCVLIFSFRGRSIF